jgi:hypothetical protein
MATGGGDRWSSAVAFHILAMLDLLLLVWPAARGVELEALNELAKSYTTWWCVLLTSE